jgi:hypothetical protein
VHELAEALAVVDVPTEKTEKGARIHVTLRRGNPEAVVRAALALPDAGDVQVEERTLTFEGAPDWIRAVIRVVVRSQMLSAGAKPAPGRPLATQLRATSGRGAGDAEERDTVTQRLPLRANYGLSLLLDLVSRSNRPGALGLRDNAPRITFPEGIALVYPANAGEGTVLVSGPAAAVNDFTAAVAVIDGPVEPLTPGGQRIKVTLNRAEPGQVRTAVLGLARAGLVQSQGKTLTFSGETGWIQAAVGQVFRQELPAVEPARPAAAQGFIRYNFQNSSVAEWLPRLRSAGIEGITLTALPLENALAARGDVPALGRLSAALGTVDVPIETAGADRRITLTLNRAGVEALQHAARALTGAGTVEVDGNSLRCEGRPEWIRAVLGLALRAELNAE